MAIAGQRIATPGVPARHIWKSKGHRMQHGTPQRHAGDPLRAPGGQGARHHDAASRDGNTARRVILVAAFAGLCAACDFNTDPAVHPPRGLAPPPPTGSTAPPSSALAFTAPVQVRVDDPGTAPVRAALPARPTRSVVPAGNR
jgi:hypothetical protein